MDKRNKLKQISKSEFTFRNACITVSNETENIGESHW